MKKRNLLVYRIFTGLFSIMLLGGALTYFFNYKMTSEMFTHLGVPTEIIYPLAIAKILGIFAIWFIKNSLIKTLAYIGFALDLVFAIITHLKAGDPVEYAIGPLVPLCLLIVSFIYYRKLQASSN